MPARNELAEIGTKGDARARTNTSHIMLDEPEMRAAHANSPIAFVDFGHCADFCAVATGGFARQHFTIERARPVIMGAHLPGMAGSDNRAHILVIVPVRELDPNGFGENSTRLCSDKGQADVWEAWQPYQVDWRGA